MLSDARKWAQSRISISGGEHVFAQEMARICAETGMNRKCNLGEIRRSAVDGEVAVYLRLIPDSSWILSRLKKRKAGTSFLCYF